MSLSSCKESAPPDKTVLAEFTPMYRSPMILNGKVKSFKWRTYWAKEKDGKIIKGDIITRLERDSLSFASDFNLELNEDGLTTKWEWITYNGEINYNEPEIVDGKIIGGTNFINGTFRNYYKREYDDSGRVLKGHVYRYGVDTLIRTVDFIYLENGSLDEVINNNYKGEITGKSKFMWKDQDHVSEHQRLNGNGELVSSMKPEYDESGNFISVTYDYPNVRLTKYDSKDQEFDDMGNMISAVCYKNDTLFCIQDFLIEYYSENY